jgi:gamma-glutamyltranspeptidase/glutathione hydrolase
MSYERVGPPGANAAIAAGHPATVDAATRVLAEGGNAFDGALAAMCAACVAEPLLASLGGGGFLMAQRAGGEAVLYDFFVNTPRRHGEPEEIEFFPVDCDFGPATQEFHIGLGATAVPGAVAGLCAAHEDLAVLPLERIVAPAVELARGGVRLRPFDAYAGGVLAPILTSSETLAGLFQRRDGAPLAAGDTLVQPELAETLEAIAEGGATPFYEGEFARRLAAFSADHGGQIGEADLGEYRVIRRQPLERPYRDARILTNPPPSSGGLLIAFALGLLDSLPAERPDAPDWLRLLARSMALTNSARVEARIHETDETQDPAARLLDPELMKLYAERLVGRASTARGTTHISVVDAAGNAAAISLSNGEGCGRMLPGTGIHLNNILGEEDLNPAGFHCWQPGQRIASMMAPTLIDLPAQGVVALGSGGSNRIRTAIQQVVVNLVDHGMSVKDAVAAPRIHVERDLVSVEPGVPQAALDALAHEAEHLKCWPECNMFFGGVHVARRDADGGLSAAGDPRRGGAATTV